MSKFVVSSIMIAGASINVNNMGGGAHALKMDKNMLVSKTVHDQGSALTCYKFATASVIRAALRRFGVPRKVVDKTDAYKHDVLMKKIANCWHHGFEDALNTPPLGYEFVLESSVFYDKNGPKGSSWTPSKAIDHAEKLVNDGFDLRVNWYVTDEQSNWLGGLTGHQERPFFPEKIFSEDNYSAIVKHWKACNGGNMHGHTVVVKSIVHKLDFSVFGGNGSSSPKQQLDNCKQWWAEQQIEEGMNMKLARSHEEFSEQVLSHLKKKLAGVSESNPKTLGRVTFTKLPVRKWWRVKNSWGRNWGLDGTYDLPGDGFPIHSIHALKFTGKRLPGDAVFQPGSGFHEWDKLVHGEVSGKGKMIKGNRDVTEGNFKNGRCVGKCEVKWSDCFNEQFLDPSQPPSKGSYEGEVFVEQRTGYYRTRFNGFGTWTLKNGDYSKGHWKNGVFQYGEVKKDDKVTHILPVDEEQPQPLNEEDNRLTGFPPGYVPGASKQWYHIKEDNRLTGFPPGYVPGASKQWYHINSQPVSNNAQI